MLRGPPSSPHLGLALLHSSSDCAGISASLEGGSWPLVGRGTHFNAVGRNEFRNLLSTSGAQEQVRSPSSAPDPGTSDGLHHCRCGQLTHRIGQAKHLMKLVTATVLGACLLFVGGCGV